MESVEKASSPLGQSVVLVGLMGAGKSKIGRLLAASLDVPFVDSDDAVEAQAGMTIAMIFELYGESRFRDLEARTIADLLDGPPCIIATGGGAFMQDETRALILKKGLSLWLKARPETLADRISNPASRPLLKDRDPAEVLRDLADIRYPVYAEADLIVDTDGLSITAAVNRVEDALRGFSAADEEAANKG
ncbi:MAG: shikimate kinase [Candidatus Puniceispirillales bacterium]